MRFSTDVHDWWRNTVNSTISLQAYTAYEYERLKKMMVINVKKTVVYTRVNGALHIENCKNYKKVITHAPAHRLSVNVLLSISTFL